MAPAKEAKTTQELLTNVPPVSVLPITPTTGAVESTSSGASASPPPSIHDRLNKLVPRLDLHSVRQRRVLAGAHLADIRALNVPKGFQVKVVTPRLANRFVQGGEWQYLPAELVTKDMEMQGGDKIILPYTEVQGGRVLVGGSVAIIGRTESYEAKREANVETWNRRLHRNIGDDGESRMMNPVTGRSFDRRTEHGQVALTDAFLGSDNEEGIEE